MELCFIKIRLFGQYLKPGSTKAPQTHNVFLLSLKAHPHEPGSFQVVFGTYINIWTMKIWLKPSHTMLLQYIQFESHTVCSHLLNLTKDQPLCHEIWAYFLKGFLVWKVLQSGSFKNFWNLLTVFKRGIKISCECVSSITTLLFCIQCSEGRWTLNMRKHSSLSVWQ